MPLTTKPKNTRWNGNADGGQAAGARAGHSGPSPSDMPDMSKSSKTSDMPEIPKTSETSNPPEVSKTSDMLDGSKPSDTSKPRLFGTDGIRGQSNRYPVTAEVATRVAMAIGSRFCGSRRHLAIIGKDTRLSGYLLEPALTAGFVSMGVDVILVGPLPTPAVAMLTHSMRGDIGVMISASHNPYHDNGLKFFDADGYKLSDDWQDAVGNLVRSGIDEKDRALPADLGRVRRLEDARGRYMEYVKNVFPGKFGLNGFKIVVDCANGANYKIAPTVLWELGADITVIGDRPDGININEKCGVTNAAMLQAAVLENKADIGLAFDGDGDRLLLVDETGSILDGDHIMAWIVAGNKDKWRDDHPYIVGTVMSNMGLENFVRQNGLQFLRTPVGDRAVVRAMTENKARLGGEASGHIVLADHSTTGDGLVTALEVLSLLVQSHRRASAIRSLFTPVPQRRRDIACDGVDVLADADVRRRIADWQKKLTGVGHLVIRRSGTEPMIRLMVQAEDETMVAQVMDDIGNAICARQDKACRDKA